jgi:hypothetical protein
MAEPAPCFELFDGARLRDASSHGGDRPQPSDGRRGQPIVVRYSHRGHFYIPLLRDRFAPFGSVKADCCALRLLSRTRESNGGRLEVTLAVALHAT